MAVVVTGGRGFIGKHLCRKLAMDGLKVISIDRKPVPLSDIDNINEIRLDIVKDKNDIDHIFKNNNIETIYHLAANTSIPIGQTDINIDLCDTFETTIIMLQCAAKYNVKNFVFTSSSTVYGMCDSFFTESSYHLQPISYYGASKLSSEAFINSFCHINKIRCWIIRCGNIIGEDSEHGVVYEICNRVKNHETKITLLGDGSQEKPFLYIDDFIEGLSFIIDNSNATYNLFLLGNDTTTSLKEIGELFMSEYPEIEIIWNNLPLWPGDVTNYSYDISKLKKLGWEPKYSSNEAICISIKKFVYNG